MIRRAASALILAATVAVGSSALATIDPLAKMDEKIVVTANIVLSFVAPVDPSRTVVDVYGAYGRVPVGTLQQGPHPYDILVPLAGSLASGTYSVEYEALTTEGSKMFGSTTITVTPADIAPTDANLIGAK